MEFAGPWVGYWMAFLRVVVGWWFLHAGLTKYAWFPGGEAFAAKGWLAGQFPYTEGVTLAAHRPDWLQAFFEFVVATPWLLDLTNFMIPLGEALIGLGVLFGALTRLASFFGAFLMFFFYFGNADWQHGFVNGDLFGLLLFITLIVWGAGRVYGLDAAIEEHRLVENNPRLRYILG